MQIHGGMYPPNNPAASPQYFHVPKLGISERYDLFFGLHFILGKKLGTWESYDLFFLVFTSFWAKNWQSADVLILLNHPPQYRKMAKNGRFCLIISPNAQHRFASLFITINLNLVALSTHNQNCAYKMHHI